MGACPGKVTRVPGVPTMISANPTERIRAKSSSRNATRRSNPREQATITGELADAAVYRDQPERVQALNERYSAIEAELMQSLAARRAPLRPRTRPFTWSVRTVTGRPDS